MSTQKLDKSIITSLKKTGTLIEHVVQMVEDGQYCPKVMQQVLASIGLLKGVNRKLYERHLQNCFAQAVKENNHKKVAQMVEEILHINNLANK